MTPIDSDCERLFQELSRWTALDAPVGFEEPVLAEARRQLQECCSRVEIDLRGNLYAWQDGPTPQAPRVMITAHADEIGFMVTSIHPQGFLRFTRLGHPTELVLPGQRVRFLTPRGPREGILGLKPGHILHGNEARSVPPGEALYADVGAEHDQQARDWGLEVGTPGVFVGPLTRTGHPRRVFGKAVDNRAGLLALLEIARLLHDDPHCPCHRVYVITVEEEVGLRGALVAAAHAQPDVVLAIDTVPAGGTPDLTPEQLPWKIGHGPLLKVRETNGLSTQRPLRELIRRVALEQNIPTQLIVDTAGITDATAAQQASGKIAAMVIGLARRYSHTAVELLDLTDLAHAIELTRHSVRAIHDRDQLRRLP